jgi:hypothetical protein
MWPSTLPHMGSVALLLTGVTEELTRYKGGIGSSESLTPCNYCLKVGPESLTPWPPAPYFSAPPKFKNFLVI